MLISLRTHGKMQLHVPLPLFVVDGLIEPLSFLASLFLWRRVPVRVAKYLPYLDALGVSGLPLSEMWKNLRWRGSFTLLDVDYGSGRFLVRFV